MSDVSEILVTPVDFAHVDNALFVVRADPLHQTPCLRRTSTKAITPPTLRRLMIAPGKRRLVIQ